MTAPTTPQATPLPTLYVRVDRPDGSRFYQPARDAVHASTLVDAWAQSFPAHDAQVVGAKVSRVDRARCRLALEESGRYLPA